MTKGYWDEERLMRLQHHLLVGNLNTIELAELFGVHRVNLQKVIKSKRLRSEPLPYHYSRKQRHIALQLLKRGLELGEYPSTPSTCESCGKKLTYNIYGDEDNNATIKLIGDEAYEVVCKECKR